MYIWDRYKYTYIKGILLIGRAPPTCHLVETPGNLLEDCIVLSSGVEIIFTTDKKKGPLAPNSGWKIRIFLSLLHSQCTSERDLGPCSLALYIKYACYCRCWIMLSIMWTCPRPCCWSTKPAMWLWTMMRSVSCPPSVVNRPTPCRMILPLYCARRGSYPQRPSSTRNSWVCM